eukprot:g43610.t1
MCSSLWRSAVAHPMLKKNKHKSTTRTRLMLLLVGIALSHFLHKRFDKMLSNTPEKEGKGSQRLRYTGSACVRKQTKQNKRFEFQCLKHSNSGRAGLKCGMRKFFQVDAAKSVQQRQEQKPRYHQYENTRNITRTTRKQQQQLEMQPHTFSLSFPLMFLWTPALSRFGTTGLAAVDSRMKNYMSVRSEAITKFEEYLRMCTHGI